MMKELAAMEGSRKKDRAEKGKNESPSPELSPSSDSSPENDNFSYNTIVFEGMLKRKKHFSYIEKSLFSKGTDFPV